MTLLPYTDVDYTGKYNLLKAQRALIKQAWDKHRGDLDKMSKALAMRRTNLLIAIIRHFNVAASPHGEQHASPASGS
jgi:hypothetical protein